MIWPARNGPGAAIEIAIYLSDKVWTSSRKAKSANSLDNEASNVVFVKILLLGSYKNDNEFYIREQSEVTSPT